MFTSLTSNQHVGRIRKHVKKASLAEIEKSQRPIFYVTSGKESKQEKARTLAQQQEIRGGPICAFTAVEPCLTWRVAGDRQETSAAAWQAPVSVRVSLLDRCIFGARLQTWFPFTLSIFLNGREWLAR